VPLDADNGPPVYDLQDYRGYSSLPREEAAPRRLDGDRCRHRGNGLDDVRRDLHVSGLCAADCLPELPCRAREPGGGEADLRPGPMPSWPLL